MPTLVKIQLQWLISKWISEQIIVPGIENHFTVIKGPIHQEDISILNLRQILIELHGKIHKPTMIEISAPFPQ